MSGGGGGTISTSEPRLGAMRVQQSSYGLALPVVYGRTRITANLAWYGDFVAIAHTTTTTSGGGGGGKGGGGEVTQQNTTYTYEAAVVMALCEGPVGGVVSIWQGKNQFTSTPLAQLGLSFSAGHHGQDTWSHLTNNHPDQAIGYSRTAILYSAAYALTSNAEISNLSFEVEGKLQFGSGIVDANPTDIVFDLLTNAQYGANFPAEHIGDLSIYSNYCRAMGLFISPAFTEQQETHAHLRTLASLTNSAFVWSEGKLKIVPYGDEAITGNGATYTPNLTPVYDLTDDDFVAPAGEDPVSCDRKTPADAFNQIQIEYLNRGNSYNIEISEAKDQANIEKYGLRPQEPVKMHGICDANVARRVAQLQLQRSLYIRNEYKFQLGWKYVLLEPMDLVTLADLGLGLDQTPVRIVDVEEDEDGLLTIRAEDYPFGVASATLYPTQAAIGFTADYNIAPGDVSDPVFFEPPIDLATATGLEVWCAVSGQISSWGGCHAWASLDGSTYKKVGTVHGGARYGTLTAPLAAAPGGSVAVSLAGLGGQMLSGTPQDAAALNTLCWIDGDTGGELVAYEAASLTGTNTYTLTGLVRGAYRSKSAAKPGGSKFVRIDQSITKSDPLDVSMIGETIYFKFTSFNVYGAGTQTLPEAKVYQHTITGDMFKLPPPDVQNFAIDRDVMRWTGVSAIDLVGYKIRYHYGENSWWPTASPLHEGVITESPYSLVNRPSGVVTLLIKAVDSTGNESENATFIVINLGDTLVDNIINSWPQHTAWAGIKTNCSVVGGQLVANSIDRIYGPDSEPMYGADASPFYALSQSAGMRYEWDVTTDAPGRLTLSHAIEASSYNIEYSRDNTEPFYGPSGNYFYGADADPMYGLPQDWASWPGYVDSKGGEIYRFRITTAGGVGTEILQTLQSNLDVPDITIEINDLVVSSSGTRLQVPAGLIGIKNIQLTLQSDGGSGVTTRYTDKTNLTQGPMAFVFNNSGTQVAGLIDAVIQAY